ncbi:major facilitator superfamily transporter [Xylona heveae TC161]|uniref:Major facilitator superfamily transporter n=1 Tax=Xylona heveae (strain CBS 132557 / TC161) TaxID=1328760 RepID=A0A164ZMF6_XYLHT|nr:major facilitator superfamily transporter [Xylona heveae TC161]KZF19279.1 major facilitator superfamily transporter [Xylona heveae TC161]
MAHGTLDSSKDRTSVLEAEENSRDVSEIGEVKSPGKPPWWSYIWDYDPEQTKEEKKFLRKLDTFLLTLLSLGYFIKNLDQTNIANAFVSGMKEDLAMNGDQLNLVDTAWTAGYVVGQIPSQIIITKVRPSIWIPSCELIWTILTFCLAAAKTSDHVIAIRFFVGLLESVFYPAGHTILGAWYKPSELGKRAGIFHASSAAAAMFSGYLQAAVYKGLNHVGGLAGWKWLFIMDGVISAPIAIAGFFLLPDTPDNTRVFYLTEKDRTLARDRMAAIGRAPRTRLGLSAFKRVFGRWHLYLFTLLYIIFINASPSSSVNPFSLWMKSEHFSVYKINTVPTAQSAIQLVTTIVLAILSDLFRKRAPFMAVSTFFGFLSSILLAVWAIPVGLKWFAFLILRGAVPYGPLSMAWVNEICGGDAEERAIVLGIMNAAGYAFNTFVPLLTYPQSHAPRFKRGFIYSTVAYGFAQPAITLAIAIMYHWWDIPRKEKAKKKEDEEGGVIPNNGATASGEETEDAREGIISRTK